jgi:hypothetical protein
MKSWAFRNSESKGAGAVRESLIVFCLLMSLGGAGILARPWIGPPVNESPMEIQNRHVTRHRVPPVFGHDKLIVRANLPVANPYSEVITINKVIPSCGCASVGLSSKEIRPKEIAQLSVEVEIPPEGGSKEISVTLDAGDGKILTHTFSVSGYPFVQVDDEFGMVSFGKVLPNQTAHSSVSLLLHAPSELTMMSPSQWKVE